jgi:hypothetical protein
LKTATLSDLPILAQYFSAYPRHLCTYTPGVLMMWRDYFRLALREEDGTLLVRLAYDGGEDSYLYPIGRDPEGMLDRLVAEMREEGRTLTLFGLDEGERDALLARFPAASASLDRGESDYLYETAALAAFPGKRYAGQRNHINKLNRLYPDHTVTPLTKADRDDIFAFLDEFLRTRGERPLLAEEIAMTREVLDHLEEYGMVGVVLRVNGRVAAFAAGEVIGDMLAVHIEKADTRVAGAYQRIVSGFASTVDPTAVPYLNREDDMNDEGLRTSKLSYHPVAILPKWRVSIPTDI